MMAMHRKTYLEVNEDNIRYNIRQLKQKSKKNLIAVIKANGYGTSDVRIARLAQKEGVELLAVSSIEEAIHLRKNGVAQDILILGEVDPSDFNIVRANCFHIVTVSKDYVLNNASKLVGVKVHIKLNTGMNRIGILPSEAKEVFDVLKENNAAIVGIMTHYVSSDDNDELTKKQYQIFEDTVKSLNYQFKYVHSCNTDATLSLEDNVSNYVRCGLGLLGYSEKANDLRQAISLYTEVVNSKNVKEGEGVSYGHHYISDGKGYILTLPIGYADGFIRANTNKKVYIENEECVIVGSICMDQMMVKSMNEYPQGTKVELFGEHISIEKRAKDLKTITYEILTNISDRVTRVFISDGQVVETINERFD